MVQSAVLTPESQLQIFRDATELIASSRDFEETMEHTIAAFLPALGDFGFFDLVVGPTVRRTARAYRDQRVEDILRPTQWIKQERTDMNLCALSTGRPALHPEIDDAWYRAIAVNDGHLQVLRDLAFTSMISVPMRYQGELLGALTLFLGRSGRRYSEAELAFAGDLAALAAPVVANARLLDVLRESEERLRVGMDAGKLGVWDWSVASDRIRWSDRIYDLHGVTRDQFGGTVEDFAALVHPDDRQRVRTEIELALAGAAPYEIEFRVPFPDGSIRWLATRAEVHRDAAGTPTRMIGATYDVTERNELLAEAARARVAAEQASYAKDQFLAMLGHELRNPLAPILTALHLMDRRDGDRSRREREIIRRQVSHLSRLVDDLLDIARITRGKIELVKERVDLVELVDRAIEASRATLVAHEVTVALDAPERPLYIDGDPVRLTQVIGNLLANALKFSPAGEQIDVRVHATGAAAIELVVTDRGAGIDPSLLPHVFDLFVQGPQELARERGGLGLGLAIVANLVALHGGDVRAHSDGHGRGSTFTVTLPRAAAAPATAHDSGPTSVPVRRPARVLVVDDNIDAAELIGDLLRDDGHEVRIAATAQAALRMVESFPPDIALLDIGLPGMDGYELARELRRRVQAHLIAVTGYGLATDRERAHEAGFDEHMVKPVDPIALRDHIARLRS